MVEILPGGDLVVSPHLDTSYRLRRVPARSGWARPGLGFMRVSRCGPFRLRLKQRKDSGCAGVERSLWLNVAGTASDFLESRSASCGVLLERAAGSLPDRFPAVPQRSHWLMRFPSDSLRSLLDGPMAQWGNLDLTVLGLPPMGCPSVELRVASAITVYGTRESTVGLRVVDILGDLAEMGGVLGPELEMDGTVLVPSAAFVPLASPDEAALVSGSGFAPSVPAGLAF